MSLRHIRVKYVESRMPTPYPYKQAPEMPARPPDAIRKSEGRAPKWLLYRIISDNDIRRPINPERDIDRREITAAVARRNSSQGLPNREL